MYLACVSRYIVVARYHIISHATVASPFYIKFILCEKLKKMAVIDNFERIYVRNQIVQA